MDQVTFEMGTSQHDSYLANYVLCSHFLSKDYLICYAKSPRILLHTFLLWPPGSNRISLAVIRRNLRRLELRCKPNEDAKREENLPWIYWTARLVLFLEHTHKNCALLLSDSLNIFKDYFSVLKNENNRFTSYFD